MKVYFIQLIGIQAMLKDIVDETSRGKYDFMYLRIGSLSLQRSLIAY